MCCESLPNEKFIDIIVKPIFPQWPSKTQSFFFFSFFFLIRSIWSQQVCFLKYIPIQISFSCKTTAYRCASKIGLAHLNTGSNLIAFILLDLIEVKNSCVFLQINSKTFLKPHEFETINCNLLFLQMNLQFAYQHP